MLRSTEESRQYNNAGFSLVELIIVVAILAIAAIPLMKSMSMASRTNATAQSIQNATSLAERVMEDVKSSDIEALVAANGGFDDAGVCTYVIPVASPTPVAGENFIVTVTIDKGAYSTEIPIGSTSRSDRVKAANVTKLPRIDEIDTLSQAVLSSEKEFNRYDDAAQSYFNEKKADYDPADPATAATVASKTVDIVKSNVTGAYTGVTVKATVTYEDTEGNQFVRDLYTGSFVQNPGGFMDSDIYIFYKMGSIAETFKIKDTSTYLNGDPANTDPYKYKDSHKVYFIRQDPSDTVGPTMEFFDAGDDPDDDSDDSYKTFTYATMTLAPSPTGTPTPVPTYPAPTPTEGEFENGEARFANIYLVTNLGNQPTYALPLTGTPTGMPAGFEPGHVYKEEARTRVYDVTVVLTKPASDDPSGREYARINSTVTASN